MTPLRTHASGSARTFPALLSGASLALLPILLVPASASAQVRASERATVTQVVDGTTIGVDYSRPVARGRADLFGGVVHWGEVWTPGANEATALELSQDVTIEGIPVPAGRWSVWMTVVEDGPWELLLDPRDTLFHTERPDSVEGQIRFDVTPGPAAHVEVLTWSFPRIERDRATLTMAWGTTTVPLEIEVQPTPIPSTAAAEAARYLGPWEVSYQDPDGGGSPYFIFDIRFEDDGSLLARTPFDAEGELSEMLLIPRAEGVFQPALFKDGEVYEVVATVLLEFEGDAGDGRPDAFAVRTESDRIWILGRRAPAEPEPAAIEVDPADLERFTGTYASDASDDATPATVTLQESGLVADLHRLGALRLVPIAPAVFRLAGAWAPARTRVTFEAGEDGVLVLSLRFPGDAPPVLLRRTGDVAAPATAAPADQDATSKRAPEWQIASAVLALPEYLREGAEVREWTDDGHLVTLREGSNGLICLADRPGDGRFSAACYHEGLEPFMERGRELLREGIEGARRNETRWREIEAGTLPMPPVAIVFNLAFPTEDFDPATANPATGSRLHALYMPFATADGTGIPELPGDGAWLMDAGTPSAHVMIGVPARRPE